MTQTLYSGVILAGDESERFNGCNKAMLKVCGQRIMDRLISLLMPVCREIIVVTRDPFKYLEWDTIIVADHSDEPGALSGIHAGLSAASNTHALVTACEMPFVRPAMIRLLLATVEPHLDVIIPRTAMGYEPLAAVYSKRCLKPMEAALMNRPYQIQRIFNKVRKCEIQEPELRRWDTDLISFYHLDSPEDLAAGERRLRQSAPEVE